MNAGRNKRASQSTSAGALKMHLRSLETRLNPNVKGRPAPGQPRPVVGAGDFWVTRRIAITKAVGTAGTDTAFSFGDIAKQLTNVAAGNVNVRITKVTVWGVFSAPITVELDIQNFTDSVGSNSSNNGLTVTDYGNAFKLPGVEYNIPKLISDPKWFNHGNVTAFATVKAPAFIGPVVAHVTVDFQPT